MKFSTFLHEDVGVEERKVLEAGASLSRVMSKLKGDGVEFGVITAFRKYENDKRVPLKVNQGKNNELLRYFRGRMGQKGYGAYRLVGHWKECSVELPDGVNISQCSAHGGKVEDSLEETWLIINDPQSDQFFDVLVEAARKYGQDAFVAKVGDKFGLFGKDGTQWESYGTLSNDSISSSFKKVIGLQGYSELKKKRVRGDVHNIVFDTIKENIEFIGISVPNDTNSSLMLYKSMGIYWK